MISAFDPGKNIGYALIDASGRLHEHGVWDLESVATRAIPSEEVVVGSGTGSSALIGVLRERGIDPIVIDETDTSREGRILYFRDHPPRGLWRLLPAGMWVPPRPTDDYAAYAIGLRYLQGTSEPTTER